MARQVIRDRAIGRQQLTAWAADPDLRSSHFERVVFPDGVDLSGFDLRDCTFLQCTARGAILPDRLIGSNSATEYVWSWDTDWRGARLPANFSPMIREWVVELWWQAAAQNLRLQLFADYMEQNRDNFTNASNLAFALQHYSREEVAQFTQEVYGPYPRLSAQAKQVIQTGIADLDRRHVEEPDFVLDAEDGERVTRAELTTSDRFVLGEDLARRLSEKKGTPWLVHVYTLRPTIWTVRVDARQAEDRWDWWPKWD